MNEAFVRGEEYTPRGEQVTEYPEEFQKWVRENADKIHEAQGRGTEPYFVLNNAEAVEGIINPKNGNNRNVSPTLPPATSSATDDDEKKRIKEARKKFDAYQYSDSDETKYRAFGENTCAIM